MSRTVPAGNLRGASTTPSCVGPSIYMPARNLKNFAPVNSVEVPEAAPYLSPITRRSAENVNKRRIVEIARGCYRVPRVPAQSISRFARNANCCAGFQPRNIQRFPLSVRRDRNLDFRGARFSLALRKAASELRSRRDTAESVD